MTSDVDNNKLTSNLFNINFRYIKIDYYEENFRLLCVYFYTVIYYKNIYYSRNIQEINYCIYLLE